MPGSVFSRDALYSDTPVNRAFDMLLVNVADGSAIRGSSTRISWFVDYFCCTREVFSNPSVKELIIDSDWAHKLIY